MNPVIRMRIDGAMANTVRMMMMRTEVDGFFSPLILTLTFDEAANSALKHGNLGHPSKRTGVPAHSVSYCHLPQAVDERIPCLRGQCPRLRCQPWHHVFIGVAGRGRLGFDL